MIDSHHYLWAYNAEEYPWVSTDNALAQHYLIPELKKALEPTGITGTVVVQARQCDSETHALLELSEACEMIRGVVGWLEIAEHEKLDFTLENYAAHPNFLGLRHGLEDEPDAFFTQDDFHAGLAILSQHNLTYDLLIFQRQIPVALKLIDRQPKVGFILDHLAKPVLEKGKINPEWKKGMRELAKRDHLRGVKFSGLLTEFPAEVEPDRATINAYLHETLAIFGSERVMFASDWPSCLLRSENYQFWFDLVTDLAQELSESEQAALFEKNATRCYNLV